MLRSQTNTLLYFCYRSLRQKHRALFKQVRCSSSLLLLHQKNKLIRLTIDGAFNSWPQKIGYLALASALCYKNDPGNIIILLNVINIHFIFKKSICRQLKAEIALKL